MDRIPSDRDHLLDLLVDGELTDAARGELLLWCEQDPQGWRRCALAFLEGQSWSEGAKGLAALPTQPGAGAKSVESRTDFQVRLAALPAQPGPGASASLAAETSRRDEDVAGEASLIPASKLTPTIEVQTRTSGGGGRWRAALGPLAMAASFLLAFGLGLWTRGGWLAGDPTQPDRDRALGNRIATQEPANVPASRGPLGQVRLVVGGPNGSADEIELPVVEGEAFDPAYLRSRPAAVPLDVEQALERMGHRVQQRRELVPLRLEDGRRLIVPVDRVEVHPVGNRDYQ
jgi:hypothetical protein